MTGHASVEAISRLREEGELVLLKPFAANEFVDALRAAATLED